jgi:CheY-like chemotaxis protein
MFHLALVLAGFDVQEAGDGLDALRALDSAAPDAVILDLGLPLISGQVVRDEIAAQAHLRHIPVIIVTGYPGDLDHLEVACVLRKPVMPDDLIDTIRRCIAAGSSSNGC